MLYETGTYEVIGAFRSEIYPDDDTEHYHYYEFFNAADKAEFDEYIDSRGYGVSSKIRNET